jgi:hypothetical protein
MTVAWSNASAKALSLQPHTLDCRRTAPPLLEPEQRHYPSVSWSEFKTLLAGNDLAELSRPKPSHVHFIFEEVINAEQRAFVRVEIQRISFRILPDNEKIVVDGLE